MAKKKKLTPDEIRKKELRKRIMRVFKNSGFAYLPTREKYREYGGKRVEIDSVFLYENVIVFCEDTIGPDSAHLLKSKETADIIEGSHVEVLAWLKESYSEQFERFSSYPDGRYRRIYLYFADRRVNASEERFAPLVIVKPQFLKYLDVVSTAIKRSTRFELFRFFGLSQCDMGYSEPSNQVQSISVNIICPQERVGLGEGVRAVSFMMSPESLIECGYVLRKDNWESPTSVYQRLIEPSRIKKIRKYVAETQQSFVNNIIVALPSTVQFRDADGQVVEIDDIQDYGKQYSICIPRESNSICIIDGQHRIYAYHEGFDNLEEKVSGLRQKLHLLVTGLVFPSSMNSFERAKYESQVFLDINNNAKSVSQEVILYIEELKDSFSSAGIARQVLSELNKGSLFERGFQLSTLDDSSIKTISIIRFAMKKLVEIDEISVNTLFRYWDGDKSVLLSSDHASMEAECALRDYVKYISSTLSQYFGAIRAVRRDDWEDGESKILSVTSINGFLIALRKTLPYLGVRDFDFYRARFSKLKMSFERSLIPEEGFAYASSQYNMMSDQVIRECFTEAIEATAPIPISL